MRKKIHNLLQYPSSSQLSSWNPDWNHEKVGLQRYLQNKYWNWGKFKVPSGITNKAHPSARRTEFTLQLQDIFIQVHGHQRARTIISCFQCGWKTWSDLPWMLHMCRIFTLPHSFETRLGLRNRREQKKASALLHNPNRLADKHSPE